MLARVIGLRRRNSQCAQTVEAAKERYAGHKGMAADGGWAFLVNDSNDFLSWQFGVKSWNGIEGAAVRRIMGERARHMSESGIGYLMIVTPEKSVAYQEFLPDEFARLTSAPDRPAAYLAQHFPEVVTYADLSAQKRQGLLYFRGDSHVNWLGAYHLYRHTIQAAKERGIHLGKPIPLERMTPSIASWEGDVLSQVPIDHDAGDRAEWKPAFLNEALVQYQLQEPKARRLPEPDVFRIGRPERETVVTEHPDKSLPRAVIFRDSTASLSVDLLAEHFSRAVFVWHEADVIGDLLECERPDVVLHFKAERFLSNYPTTLPISWGTQGPM